MNIIAFDYIWRLQDNAQSVREEFDLAVEGLNIARWYLSIAEIAEVIGNAVDWTLALHLAVRAVEDNS